MMSLYEKALFIFPNDFERSHIILFIMAHPYASTSGVLPIPICLLCGVEILATNEVGMPQGRPKLDEHYWRKLWKPDLEPFMVSSYEVESAYHVGKFPRLWACLFRASKPLPS